MQASHKEQDLFLSRVDELFSYCLKQCITDIHLCANGQIRLRHQNKLIPYLNLCPKQSKQLRLRFKILGGLDINQEQLPQDGHCLWTGPSGTNTLACRLSTCPTWAGEKMVVRILQHQKLKLSWNDLGLKAWQQNLIAKYSQKNDGLIIINGPTGSGKTTTLYTLLEYINSGDINIVSIEDPIEVPYLNFNQIELNAELGFGIETCIRTVLRQDPDLIMIGEIRDAKTARLALEAVLTGHLVLTSLHAPSNLGVIDRLKQLGINPEEIIPYLHLLVSQRYHEEKKQVQFELLELTPEIKQNILNHPGHHAICQSIIC